MQIDAHHHLWRYRPEDYAWMGESPGPLGRDYLAADLGRLLSEGGLHGTVAVQARECLEENRFLVEQAEAEPRILGLVGWVPFREESVVQRVEELAGEPRFKGVRHILQAEPDMEAFIGLASFNAGLQAVQRAGLRYDLLITAGQLGAAIRLVDRYPDLPMVVDHLAKPRLAGPPDATWAAAMRELARRPHVCCKLSGLVTEVPGFHWSSELCRPYFLTVLEAFGPERLMFGSDWPVCLLASSHERWLATVRDWVSPLGGTEQAAIMGGTACAFYGLPDRADGPRPDQSVSET